MPKSPTHNLLSASLWSVAADLATKAIPPLTLLILARFLAPEEFGVIAAATGVVSLSQIFIDAGLGKALIQSRDDAEQAANVVFWSNLALGALLYGALLTTAPVLAKLFDDPRVAPAVQVLAAQLLLTAAYSTHNALFQKALDFRPLFQVRLITALVPNLLAIPLAIAGVGYWALIIATLVGHAGQLTLLWRRSHWRPSWHFNRAIAVPLMKFGAWSSAEGGLTWVYLWADSLIIGAVLTTHDLGLYRTGGTMATMIFGATLAPLLPVLFSYFSGLQEEPQRIAENLQRVTKGFTIIAFGAAIFLFTQREELAEAIFGERWQGVGLVLGTMALMHGVSWVVGANGEAYRAIGRPDLNTKLMAFNLITYLPGYLLAAPHGLKTFVWTRFGLAVVALAPHLYLAYRYLGVTTRGTWQAVRSPTLAAAATMTMALVLPDWSAEWGTWPRLIVHGILLLGFYGIIIGLLERDYILWLSRSMLAKLRKP